MKDRYFFMFLNFIFRWCNKKPRDISGQYINGSAGRNSRAFDLIEIIKQEHKKNLFSVERKFLCGRIKKGKIILKEFSFEKWAARYSEKRNVLTAIDKGERIDHIAGKKKILHRNIMYLKLS